MRLALMVHVAVFTSTGFSEVILLPATRRPWLISDAAVKEFVAI
jgi:hypothetical protein